MVATFAAADLSQRLQQDVLRSVAYDHDFGEPRIERYPVSPVVAVIISVGRNWHDDATGPQPTDLGAFAAGLSDRCAVVEHGGRLRGLQVDLTPVAAARLFRLPMHMLARTAVALEDLLGREALELRARLEEARSWPARLGLVEEAIAVRLAAAPPAPADVAYAWRRLVVTRGRLSVQSLADELGCSRKHLAVRFREYVGLPPRLVARTMRFRHALTLLRVSPATIADVALDAGYYDEAHLYRDFSGFAGSTPTAFRASPPVTSVQDGATELL
jgi:AraC-like DNA-binding protein